jgi:hypothetical protein
VTPVIISAPGYGPAFAVEIAVPLPSEAICPDLTCEIAASCDSGLRIRMADSHEAVKPHVIGTAAGLMAAWRWRWRCLCRAAGGRLWPGSGGQSQPDSSAMRMASTRLRAPALVIARER